MLSALTVCGEFVTSSVPPLTVTPEFGERRTPRRAQHAAADGRSAAVAVGTGQSEHTGAARRQGDNGTAEPVADRAGEGGVAAWATVKVVVPEKLLSSLIVPPLPESEGTDRIRIHVQFAAAHRQAAGAQGGGAAQLESPAADRGAAAIGVVTGKVLVARGEDQGNSTALSGGVVLNRAAEGVRCYTRDCQSGGTYRVAVDDGLCGAGFAPMAMARPPVC